jgi:hypothetical protein
MVIPLPTEFSEEPFLMYAPQLAKNIQCSRIPNVLATLGGIFVFALLLRATSKEDLSVLESEVMSSV